MFWCDAGALNITKRGKFLFLSLSLFLWFSFLWFKMRCFFLCFFVFLVSSSSSPSNYFQQNTDFANVNKEKEKGHQLRWQPTTSFEDSAFHIAFIFVGPLNDVGWSYQHNFGRIALERQYFGEVSTEVFPEVSDDPAISLPFIADLCSSGRFQMIVGTTFGYQGPLKQLAEAFPSMYFLHISGDLPAPPNMGLASGQMWQARYLTGFMTSLMGYQRVGMILAIPIAPLYRTANALYKGILDGHEYRRQFLLSDNSSSESNVPKLILTWTGSFFNRDLESYHANYLFDEYEVENLHHHTDTFEPQFVANKRGKTSVGYSVDAGAHVSISVLVSAMWDWGSVYAHFVNGALTKNWTAKKYWGTFGEGVVLSSFSPLVPIEIQEIVNERAKLMKEGNFEIFCGEWIEQWWTGPNPPTADDCLDEEQIVSFETTHTDIIDGGFVEIPTTQKTLSSGMVIAMQTLAALSLFLVFVCAVLMAYWRECYALRFSSVPFLYLCLLGCATVFVAVFLLSETPTDSLCASVVWVLSLGSTLFFAPILAKTYRVNVVMQGAKNMRIVNVSNGELAISVLGCLLIDITLLICFQVIDSPVAKRDFNEADLEKFEYWMVCSYPDASTTIIYLILGWKGLLLFVGCCLTFMVRSANPIINEARSLMLAIYDLAFACAVLIPLVIVLNGVEAKYLIISLGILFATNFAYLIIFLPKFWVIITDRDQELVSTGMDSGKRQDETATTSTTIENLWESQRT